MILPLQHLTADVLIRNTDVLSEGDICKCPKKVIADLLRKCVSERWLPSWEQMFRKLITYCPSTSLSLSELHFNLVNPRYMMVLLSLIEENKVEHIRKIDLSRNFYEADPTYEGCSKLIRLAMKPLEFPGQQPIHVVADAFTDKDYFMKFAEHRQQRKQGFIHLEVKTLCYRMDFDKLSVLSVFRDDLKGLIFHGSSGTMTDDGLHAIHSLELIEYLKFEKLAAKDIVAILTKFQSGTIKKLTFLHVPAFRVHTDDVIDTLLQNQTFCNISELHFLQCSCALPESIQQLFVNNKQHALSIFSTRLQLLIKLLKSFQKSLVRLTWDVRGYNKEDDFKTLQEVIADCAELKCLKLYLFKEMALDTVSSVKTVRGTCELKMIHSLSLPYVALF